MTKPKSYWGMAVTVIYTAFALSTLGFVAFAMTKPVDLVSQDYYQRSLTADRTIEATRNARSLGSLLNVAMAPSGEHLIVQIPTAGAVGSVTFYRPSHSGSDQSLALSLVDGRQVLDLTGLARGRWLVQVAWTSDGRPFYHELGLQLR